MNDLNKTPQPPFNLRDRGLHFWNEIYFLLNSEGNIEEIDLYLLGRYCDSLAEWEELNDWSKHNEPFKEMVSSKNVTYFAKHPKISRLETLEPHLLRMEKALGMGKRSRSQNVGMPPAASDLDNWLHRTLNRSK